MSKPIVIFAMAIIWFAQILQSLAVKQCKMNEMIDGRNVTVMCICGCDKE